MASRPGPCVSSQAGDEAASRARDFYFPGAERLGGLERDTAGAHASAPIPEAQPAADRGARQTDEAIDDIHPGRQRSHVGARTTLAEEINMRDIIEDRRVLRMQFEAFAHNARNESGKPESAYCFDALAGSVDEVSPELLEAYVEMFQKIEHRKIGSALRQSIQQGLWLPTSATEYMQRFIAFASGTGAPS